MVGEGGRGRTDFALHAGFTRHAGQRIEVHPDAKPRTSSETVGENGGESLEYVTGSITKASVGLWRYGGAGCYTTRHIGHRAAENLSRKKCRGFQRGNLASLGLNPVLLFKSKVRNGCLRN